MNTVRTTVSLEKTLHHQLLTQAYTLGLSFNQVVNMKLANKNFGAAEEKTVNDTFGLALFSRLAKKLKKTDWVKLVREDRDK